MKKSKKQSDSNQTSKISQAVSNCINRLAIAQQNMRAFETILYRMRDKEAVSQATITEMHKALYADISRAWDDLAFFAPISSEAMELLNERTRTWFDRDDAGVMHWLGFYGSYNVKDKAAFLAEVRAMFTGVAPSDDPPHNTD